MQEVFPFSQNSANWSVLLHPLGHPQPRDSWKHTKLLCWNTAVPQWSHRAVERPTVFWALSHRQPALTGFITSYWVLWCTEFSYRPYYYIQVLFFLRTNYFLAPLWKINKYPVDLKQRKQSTRVLNMLRLLLKPIHQLNCLQGGYSDAGLVCDRNLRPTAHTVEQQSEATNPIGSHPKIHLYQRESSLWFQ